MPKLKTYRYSHSMTPVALRNEWELLKQRGELGRNISTSQCVIYIGAPTKKRACELLKISTREIDLMSKSYEPGDPLDPATEKQPETPLYRPLDSWNDDFRMWTLTDGIPEHALYDPAAAKLRALAIKLYAAGVEATDIDHIRRTLEADPLQLEVWENVAAAATEHFRAENKR